jgi:signal transduction histidine kinase
MPDLTFAIQAPALLVLILVQRKLGSDPAARSWVLAWVVAYVYGLAGRVLDPSGSAGWVINGAGILFSWLILDGARAFADRGRSGIQAEVLAVTGWLVAVGLSFVALPPSFLFASAVMGGFLIAAALHVWTSGHPRNILEETLGVGLAGLAVLQFVSLVFAQETLGGIPVGRLTWESMAPAIALLQISVLAARARRLADVAEDSLEIKQQNALEMFLSAPLALVLVTQADRVELVNDRMREDLGLSPEEPAPGRTVSELFERAGGKLHDSNGQDLDPAEMRLGELAARSFDFWPSAQPGRCLEATPLALPRGTSLGGAAAEGTILMMRDVTERRRVGELVREAERHETVGTLARGIAHDFNNQLASILVNAALLRSEVADRPLSLEKVQSIADSGERCAKMTSELLSLARRGPTARDAVDLFTVVGQVVRLVQPLLASGVEIEMRMGGRLPPLAADVSELQRVLTNLLINASEILGESGRIVISAQTNPLDPGRLDIEVADDGPGVAPNLRSRIFDPFFSTREREGGLGLGLAVVRGIVEAHGGSIEVGDSTLGGASFRMIWPVAKATMKEEEADSGPSRIVVVSPDGTSRTVFHTTLEVAGFEVLTSSDVSECRALLNSSDKPFDAVLLDSSVSAEEVGALATELQGGSCQAAFFALRRDGEEGAVPSHWTVLPEGCPPEALISSLRMVSHSADRRPS